MFKNIQSFLSSWLLPAVFILFPSVSMAVGLGNLSVNSKLGEELNLEVDLLSVTPAEIGSMSVGLASRSDFARADIAYPQNAGLLEFNIVEGADGSYYVSITSTVPTDDTFLHLLVSATWSGGKVVREYTALLDPPLYSGQPASVVEVPLSAESDADVDTAISITSTGTSSSSTATSTSESYATSSEFPSTVTVQRGDTLSAIVNSLNIPGSTTMYQGLTALLEANPDAFIDNNMNRLIAGAVLRVPSVSSISAIDRQTALQQFQSQTASYNQYLTDIGYLIPTDSSVTEEVDEPVDFSAQEPEELPDEDIAETDTASESIAQEAAEPEIDLSELNVSLDAEESIVEDEIAEEAQLSISQETGDEELASAMEGELGDEEQLEALKIQLAELDESLLASGVESDEVKQRLAEIQAQVERVSKLIEIEDTSLALSQDRAVEEEMAENEEEVDDALAVVDQSGQLEEGGETGLAGSDTSTDTTDSATVSEDDSSITAIDNTGSEVSATAGSETTVAEQSVIETTSLGVANTETTLESEAVVTEEQQQEEPQQQVEQPAQSGSTRQVSQSSIMDSISGIFGGIGDYALKIVAGLLALLAALFFYRRRKSQQEFEESMLDIESGQVSSPSSQSVFGGLSEASGIDLDSRNSGLDLTIGEGMSYLSEGGVTGVADEDNEVIQSGAVDPLAEADVYLAYDRDEQAIQVLKEAYSANPERHELAEKLLEIYHKQDDRIAFDSLAGELRSRIGAKQSPVWTKVAAMGKEVSPGNDLYEETGEFQAISTQAETQAEIQEEVDSAVVNLTADELDDGGLDMDSELGDVADQTPQTIIEDNELDIVGSDHSSHTEIKTLEMDDLELSLLDDEPAIDRALDAPTLSQIVSAAEAEKLAEQHARRNEEEEIGEIEFNLGDLDAEDDLDDEESSELVNVLSKINKNDNDSEEILMDDLEDSVNSMQAAEAGGNIEESSELANVLAKIDADTGGLDEVSVLSEITEQTGSNMEPYHESETALELAKAYLELGEKDIAKGFIEEVINEGSEKQKAKAEKLVKELVD